ncbi:MAG: DUF3483 domain-containing protein [Hyphomicrobiales bacterium]|nr:DUF3483 domain-containing protein [Hyphomicrobiales bacterium]
MQGVVDAAGAVFAAGLVLTVVAMAWRSSRWMRGRPARTFRLRDLFRLPRRYLVDIHDIVARDGAAARMHVFAAGGFVATSALIFLTLVLGLSVLAVPLALAALVMLAGAGVAAWRRWWARSDRLPSGAHDLVPPALAAFALFYGGAALGLVAGRDLPWNGPAGLVVLVAGVLGTVFFFPGLAVGPMRHAFAGATHLVLHPRPQRFGDRRAGAGAPSVTALRPLDLDGGDYGVRAGADFSRPQLLSFDACVRCGRCEAACPAFAAGAPLSPRALIIGLSSAGLDRPVVGDSVAADVLWSCTTCRACVESCPMTIEHVDAVLDLRREQCLEQGAVPGKGAEVLENLRQTDTPSGKMPAERWFWAADLDLPRASAGAGTDVLLWAGEGGFDLRGRRTLRALVRVLRAAGVDFAVLGEDEADVGDIARRLGDEATFRDLARRNIETLSGLRFRRILTPDPHVLHCLGEEYPALGGTYDVVHHTTFINDLLRAGRLHVVPRSDRRRVTYHDPCYLGRYGGEFDAPRQVLEALAVPLTEMPRNRTTSFCCGWGGGVPFTEPPVETRIPDLRMAEARASHADTVAVACPNCAVMLEGVPDPRCQVVDIAELVADALDGRGGGEGDR